MFDNYLKLSMKTHCKIQLIADKQTAKENSELTNGLQRKTKS